MSAYIQDDEFPADFTPEMRDAAHHIMYELYKMTTDQRGYCLALLKQKAAQLAPRKDSPDV